MRARVVVPGPHVVEHFAHGCHVSGLHGTGGHGFTWQSLASVLVPQAVPPATVLLRLLEPQPHFLEQALQLLQLPSLHGGFGQGCLLQTTFSMRGLHFLPLRAAGLTIVLLRDWNPPLHGCEHFENSVHALTTQSTFGGHDLSCVHDLTSFVIAHGCPPLQGFLRTSRRRVCEPAPQVDEQEAHVFQNPTSQSHDFL